MIHIYIGIATLLILGYLLLKYLDGDFTYTEEIIEEGILTSESRKIGKYFIIKRTYKNGRIKIIREDL